ncbi:uncharacterized protein FIBRA_06101 [Fibroporia radiculosa]|uniref:Aldehyde dehydrogenase domain-containing protein n=1 Tax=Fibroporia radiculosa TaxID=599839 RepID=J4GAN6_9APHY|nr:uncharacterized protein FIBRA_06101 [Fibroporia radiculosa]CCM03948.1 predicted protein [Fibroporia radiculosa]
MSAPFVPLYIDGEYTSASNGATYDVRNPHSSQVVSTAASASSEDCTRAVEAAARAFETWEYSTLEQRRDILFKAAELIQTDKYAQKIHSAVTEENASVDSIVLLNIIPTVGILRHVATLVNELKGETFPSAFPGGQVLMQRRAQGVNFGMAPWNFPVPLVIKAVTYPLVCGNTVVLKTSEYSPRSHQIVAELLEEAGLPKGVLNVVHVSREDAPDRVAQIIAHPAVRTINFTGGSNVGKIVAGHAAKFLKPCVLELGGKAPAVVLNDANLALAARAITSSALLHSGQICMSTERVIVQKGVASDFLQALADEFKKFSAGGPGAMLSAVVHEGSAANIVSIIQKSMASGAQCLVGDGARNGAVVQPHIVTGAKPGMPIWDQETFGPVVAVAEVDTEEEAVALANTTDYSLVSSLWTKDLNKAVTLGMKMRYGAVNINGPTAHAEAARDNIGLGGSSGYGRFHVDSFTDSRLIVIHPTDPFPYPLTG